jgi:DNA-directed RNA polymerase specialized sigma24 family protein
VPLLLQLAVGYPLHTIAAMLDCNVNTIKTRLHRARLRFRQLYGATEDSAGEREGTVSGLQSRGGV